MRERFSFIIGVILVATGILWILSGPLDFFEIPLRFIAPAVVILVGGAMLLFGRGGGDGGAPPSQFERDDAPRVP